MLDFLIQCNIIYSLISLFTQAVKYLDPQIRLAEKAGKQKKEYKLSMLSQKTLEKVADLAATRIETVFTDPSYGKVCASFVSVSFEFVFVSFEFWSA